MEEHCLEASSFKEPRSLLGEILEPLWQNVITTSEGKSWVNKQGIYVS